MKVLDLIKNRTIEPTKSSLKWISFFGMIYLIPSLGIFGQDKPAAPAPAPTAGTVATPAATPAPAAPTPEEEEENKYVSPLKANGLTPDYNRSMLIEPELSRKVTTRKKAWLNDWVRVGAYIRPRFEDRENLAFDKANKGDISRIMQTSQLFFIIDPSPYFSMKVNIQDARVWGGETPASPGDVRANTFAGTATTVTAGQSSINPAGLTTLREGWFMLKKLPLDAKLQIGRQILSYGDQRMIGGANWTINGLSYDGARLMFDHDTFNIHLLGYKLVGNQSGPNGVLSANAPVGTSVGQPDKYLVGTYNTIKPAKDWFLIDVYSLGILTHKTPMSNTPPSPTTAAFANGADNTPNAWNKQQDNLITTGFRITNRTAGNNLPKEGPWGGWDWTLEAAWQSGSTGTRVDNLVGGQDITTSATIDGTTYTQSIAGTKNQKYTGQFYVFQTGYTFAQKLRLGVQWQYASGDGNRQDGSNGTFQTLTNPRFGVIPYFNNVAGLSENIDTKNLRSFTVNASYKTDSFGTFYFSYFINNKAMVQDSWYAINGTSSATGNVSTEANNGSTTHYLAKLGRNIYNEFDIGWNYTINDYCSLWLGAGFLTAGDAVKNARNALYTYSVNNTTGAVTLTPTAVLNNISAPSVYGPAGAASQARMFYLQVNAVF
ncbi:alginate export [Leptospira langatensis]|uniref:Alginate export n=1 Tax=Leptospira langatensis TaxID=2484983 RepID=A0A5F1ZXY3_9LEPT|nr:alginate export family protein [Leptospira langatensis]TGK04301.1 alginate export [Leptospira langatensis]TGL43781.1 alginate export [Leptospira langatensis]